MSSSDSYKSELTRAMSMLAVNPRTVFMGQGVLDSGTFMSATFEGVPSDKKIEMPVAEEMQLGMAIGMSLAGQIPIAVYPRWNFLLLATNQLVNHLDKMRARVIVRVGIGSSTPLDPGPQHVGDFTKAFRSMLQHTVIKQLFHTDDIIPAYRAALKRNGPTVLVEVADKYST